MSKARAVLISDVHFNINTLELASTALRMALAEAQVLNVPLIIAGDLNDTKAMLRGEVANRLIEIFSEAAGVVRVIVLVGNHDLINEKAKAHSLNFLKPFVEVIDSVYYDHDLQLYFLPYHSNTDELRKALADIPKGSTLIMHQGFLGAAMGEYVVDKSSIDPSEVADFRVITGHYHRRQTVGTVEYIGTPYSITFAEAQDGPKGFRVLRDVALGFVPTNLRKHVTIETDVEGLDIYLDTGTHPAPNDLLWLKVSGLTSELDKLNKKEIGKRLLGHSNFKLDKIYVDGQAKIEKRETLTDTQLLDQLIDNSEETATQKAYLKKLWRDICA